MWADDKANKDHPSSTLFPSPQLVQPASPQLSFTPGKILVGSTPQLNKLQAAWVHGTGFNTPAPPKLQACFKARFTPAPSDEKLNLNLIDRFNSVKTTKSVERPAGPALRRTASLNKSDSSAGPNLRERLNNIKRAAPRIPTADGKQLTKNIKKSDSKSSISDNSDSVNSSSEDVLNGTFTMDQPTVLPPPTKKAGNRKRSMIPAPSASYQTKRMLPNSGVLNKRTGNKKPGTSYAPRQPNSSKE